VPLANRMRMVGKRLMKAIFYDEGIEYVPWVEGYSLSGESQSKEEDHLYLRARNAGGGTAVKAYVIDIAVDVTKIDKVKVDWASPGGHTVYFVVSTVKMDNYTTYDARYLRNPSFERTENEVDVSALTGLRYIRVHARSEGGTACTLRIYKVWGEDAEGNIVNIPIPKAA